LVELVADIPSVGNVEHPYSISKSSGAKVGVPRIEPALSPCFLSVNNAFPGLLRAPTQFPLQHTQQGESPPMAFLPSSDRPVGAESKDTRPVSLANGLVRGGEWYRRKHALLRSRVDVKYSLTEKVREFHDNRNSDPWTTTEIKLEHVDSTASLGSSWGGSPLDISDVLHPRIRTRGTPPALRHGVDGRGGPQGPLKRDSGAYNIVFPRRCPITWRLVCLNPVFCGNSLQGMPGCAKNDYNRRNLSNWQKDPSETCIIILVKIDRYWEDRDLHSV